MYPSSSSFIRKADRREVSTFSLTATIIVDKSFLRIQVIAYISTTDARNPSVPIFTSRDLDRAKNRDRFRKSEKRREEERARREQRVSGLGYRKREKWDVR